MKKSIDIFYATRLDIERVTGEDTAWTTVTVCDDKGDEFGMTLFGHPIVSIDGQADLADRLRAEVDEQRQSYQDLYDLSEKRLDRALNAEKACEALRAARDHKGDDFAVKVNGLNADLEQLREELAGEREARMFTEGQLAEVKAELTTWQNDEDLPEVKTLMNPLPPAPGSVE